MVCQNSVKKTVLPPPLDTGIPDYHDFIFIKEVDTTNGDLYLGEGGVIHDFWYLGKGNQDDKIFFKMLYFWLIYAQY